MSEAQLSMETLQKLLPATYTLEKPLAAGSFGQTYLAHTETAPCVIKMLSLHRSEDWKCIDLFERESKLLKHLDHLHIPNYIDSFTLQDEKETYFLLVQEYVRGKTLTEWLEDGRRFQYAEILTLAWQAADILVYLHGFQPPIIHRDLKPSNFMLDENDKLWIIDFGAVRDTLLTQGTRGSTIIGTFGYMPMEQYEGRAQPASDLYALGMTLIYLLTRQEPSQLPKHQLKPAFRSRCQVPESFSRVLDRLVEIDLHHRYRSAEKLRQDIAHLQYKQKNHQHSFLGNALKSVRAIRATGAIAAVILVLLSFFALIWTLGQDTEQAVLAPPEQLSVSDAVLEAPAPWQRLDTKSGVEQLALTQSGGQWYRLYAELYYKKADSPRFFKWSSEQILGAAHFSGLISDEKTVFVLGAHEGQKQSIAYTQEPDADWQRIELPVSESGARFLFVDRSGNPWVSQKNKIWMYDFTSHRWLLQLTAAQDVYAAAFDPHQQLWFTSVNTLFLKAKAGIQKKASLQNGYIQTMGIAHDQVGLSTSEGVYFFDMSTRQTQHFLANHRIRGLHPLGQGWVVGAESSGLYWINKGVLSPWTYREGMLSDEVKAVAVSTSTLGVAFEDVGVLTAPLMEVSATWLKTTVGRLSSEAAYANACEIPAASLAAGGSVSRAVVNNKTHTFFDEVSVCPVGTVFKYQDRVFYFDKDTLFQQQKQSVLPVALPLRTYSSPEHLLYTPEHIWLNYGTRGNFQYRSSASVWTKLSSTQSMNFVAHGPDVYSVSHHLSGDLLSRVSKTGTLTPVSVPEDLKATLHYVSGYDAAFVPAKGTEQTLAIATTRGLVMIRDLNSKHPRWVLIDKSWGLPTDFVQRIAVSESGVWMSLYKRGLAYYDFDQEAIFSWSTREGIVSQFIQNLALQQNRLWLQSIQGRVASYKITDLLKKHAKIQKNTTRNAGS